MNLIKSVFFTVLFSTYGLAVYASDCLSEEQLNTDNIIINKDDYEQFGDWFGEPAQTDVFETTQIADDRTYFISIINNIFLGDGIKFGDNNKCPFDTDAECEIWRKKPAFSQIFSETYPTISQNQITDFVNSVNSGNDLNSSNAAIEPFVNNYDLIVKYSNICCMNGIIHVMKASGASDETIYRFLINDLNSYDISGRCLMMTDDYLNENNINPSVKNAAKNIRTSCLKNNQKIFESLVNPFETVYAQLPEFKSDSFDYTYTDAFNIDRTVSINSDIQTVLQQLKNIK